MGVKRFLFYILLSVALTVTLIPTIAFGDDGDGDGGNTYTCTFNGATYEAEGSTFYFDENQGALAISSGLVYDEVSESFIGTAGETVSLSIWCYEQYKLDEVTAQTEDGDLEVVYNDENGTYDFVMPDSAVQVDVNFIEREEENEVLWNAYAKETYFYISKANPTAELEVLIDDENCEETPELSFQWSRYVYDEEEETGFYEEIEGETQTTYTATQAGQYYCRVEDDAGNSTNIWFTVELKADWTVGPEHDEYYISKSNPEAVLKVVSDFSECEETPKLSYQWHKGYEESVFEGETSDTYTVAKEGSYCCTVTDEDGCSSTVWYSVYYQTEWEVGAAKSTVYISKKTPEAELRVVADISACGEDDPGLTYQWKRIEYNSETGDYDSLIAIEGENNETYTAKEEGRYRCEVTDADGHSTIVPFTVKYQTAWSAEAEESEVLISKDNPTAKLIVATDTSACGEDDPGLTYQWYDIDEGEMIEEATSETCTVTKTGTYTCTVTDSEEHFKTIWFWVQYQTEWIATADEGTVYLSSTNPEAVLKVDTDIEACEEDPELSFQWFNGDSEEELEGETGDTYTATKEGYYRCVVTDNEGRSASIEFWVYYQPDWNAEAEKDEVYISKDNPQATLKVVTDITACSENPGLTYQWYDDSYDTIEGATNETYTATTEGRYRCEVKDSKGHYSTVYFEVYYQTDWAAKAKENEVYISKADPTAELIVIPNIEACEEDPGLQYQWYCLAYGEENGDEYWKKIVGEKTETYKAEEAGEYSCKVTDSEGHAKTINFWVYSTTDWTISNETIRVGISKANPQAELKVEVDTTACEETPSFTYQWYDYEDEEIDGATSDTYTAAKVGSYSCTVTDQDGHNATCWFEVFNDFSALTSELMGTAEEINAGEEKSVDAGTKDGLFIFTPTADGMYAFSSKYVDNEDADPIGRVADEDGNEIARDDDSVGSNFQIIFEAKKGKTYYLQAIDYDGAATFAVELMNSNISSISFVPSEEPLIAEKGCDDDGFYEIYSSRRVGDELTLHHPDNTSTVYVCRDVTDSYGEPYCTFVNKANPEEELPGYVEFNMEYEYDSDIAAGSTREITVQASYMGLKAKAYTTTVKFVKRHYDDLNKTDAVPPTCDAAGNSAYWFCSRCKKYYSDPEGTEEIAKGSWIEDKLGHAWGKPSYEWAEDGSSCKATVICQNDGEHKEIENGVITNKVKTPATCESKGTTTYTATFTKEQFAAQTKDVEDIPALTHNYKVTYDWAADGSTCRATATCQRDASHVITEDGKITDTVKTPAACESKGTTTYTATFSNELFAAQTKDVEDIPALSHDYKVTYDWADDGSSCSATATCQHDASHVITEDGKITNKVKTPATCESKGITTYTAAFSKEQFATQTKDIANIPKKEHNLTKVAAKAATSTADGNKEHYKCTVCGKLFADADGKTALSEQDVTIPKLISIKGAKVTPKKASMVWTGKALKPGVKSVVLNGKTLTTTDYSVVYTSNKIVGTAKITVIGKGKYTGKATATFKITKATQKVKSVSPTKKTVRAGASFKITAKMTKENATAQFKKAAGNANISIASSGKVTVKKGAKAGKYTVKYKVRGKATKNCKATKYVTKKIIVTVK